MKQKRENGIIGGRTDGVIGGGRLSMADFQKLMAQQQTDPLLAAVQKLRWIENPFRGKRTGSAWQGWVASGWF